MSNKTILKVAVNVPLSREFDYLPPQRGQSASGHEGSETFVGCRVLVPFGRRQQVGVVLGRSAESDVPAAKLKQCSEVLDSEPLLSDNDLWLVRFVSNYYHHPIGEVVAAALPTLLRQGLPLHPTIEKLLGTDLAAQTDVEALVRRAPKQAELLMMLLDAGGDGIDTERLTGMLPKLAQSGERLNRQKSRQPVRSSRR